MDREWIMRKGSASYWSASGGELDSTESPDILLVQRDWRCTTAQKLLYSLLPLPKWRNW
jgi:hypothetical protein